MPEAGTFLLNKRTPTDSPRARMRSWGKRRMGAEPPDASSAARAATIGRARRTGGRRGKVPPRCNSRKQGERDPRASRGRSSRTRSQTAAPPRVTSRVGGVSKRANLPRIAGVLDRAATGLARTTAHFGSEDKEASSDPEGPPDPGIGPLWTNCRLSGRRIPPCPGGGSSHGAQRAGSGDPPPVYSPRPVRPPRGRPARAPSRRCRSGDACASSR